MNNSNATRKNDLFEGKTTVALYVCIGTVGILGNSLVIFVLSKSANMRKKMVNILLINQSALDLTASVCLVTMGYHKMAPLIVTFSPIAADLYCRFIGSKVILWGCANCSTWNLVLINLERYISVSFPAWHKTSLGKKHIIPAIMFAWIFGLLLSFCVTALTSGYADGTCYVGSNWPSEELSLFASIAYFTIQFIIPIIIMIFCYTVIIKVVRQRAKVGSSAATNAATSSDQHQKGRNVLKTLALVTLTFVICWTPNIVVYALYLTKVYTNIINTTFYHFTVYLVCLNCCLNPFIYAAQYKDFQAQIRKFVCQPEFREETKSAATHTTQENQLHDRNTK